jgi:hypothetical protein
MSCKSAKNHAEVQSVEIRVLLSVFGKDGADNPAGTDLTLVESFQNGSPGETQSIAAFRVQACDIRHLPKRSR